MHGHSEHPPHTQVRDVLSVGLSPDKLLRLLLATAQLEFKLSELLKSLLATKQVCDLWDSDFTENAILL